MDKLQSWNLSAINKLVGFFSSLFSSQIRAMVLSVSVMLLILGPSKGKYVFYHYNTNIICSIIDKHLLLFPAYFFLCHYLKLKQILTIKDLKVPPPCPMFSWTVRALNKGSASIITLWTRYLMYFGTDYFTYTEVLTY